MMGEIVKTLLDRIDHEVVLYRAPEPYTTPDGITTRYFYVSSRNFLWVKETMIFPANEDGEVLSWLEVYSSDSLNIYEVIHEFETEVLGVF